MKIGINQFSYHRYFGEVTRWETDPGIRWTVADFIRRAGSLRLDAISLQTHYLNSKDLEIVKDELGTPGWSKDGHLAGSSRRS